MKRLVCMLTAAALLAALSGTAQAQDGERGGGAEDALSVTNNLDSGPGSFRQAMTEASASGGSDTITFTGVFPITVTTPVSLTGSAAVVVNGNGSTISGGGSVQILTATAPITFNDITLESGMSSTGGGAVSSTNTVVINDSTLASNSAGTSAGGAINAPDVVITNSTATSLLAAKEAGEGGLVFGTNVDIIGSDISDIEANRGGVVQGDDVNVTGSTFTDNDASEIGGVLRGTDVTVISSTLTDNHSNSGGAVDGETIVVTNSNLSDNTSDGVGGAIRVIGDPAVTITNSSLRNNIAGNNGGAVYASGGTTTVTVTDSYITDNQGVFGGGISTSASGVTNLTVRNTTLSGNTGTNGGAISTFGGTATATVQNSTLVDNTATGADGAVRVSGLSGTIDLAHATIAGNVSQTGPSLSAANLTAFGSVVTVELGDDACAIPTTTSTGYNYDNDGSCGFGAGTDDVSDGPDPLLSPLRDNGDATAAAEAGGTGVSRATMFPLSGSPLLDTIPSAECSVAPELANDERGVSRPFGAGCDIGAIESVFPAHDRNDVTPFYEATVRWVTSPSNTPQILSGFNNGSFGQNLNITRGQAARLYYNGAGAPDVSGLPPHEFTDSTPFFEDAIRWAKDEGLFLGFPDNTFRPNNPINRGNYTRSLYNFAGAQDVTALADHPFTDVTPFYEDAVKWAKARGLANGFPNNTYRQNNNINRGNAARTFYNTAQSPDAWAIAGIAPTNMIFRPNV